MLQQISAVKLHEQDRKCMHAWLGMSGPQHRGLTFSDTVCSQALCQLRIWPQLAPTQPAWLKKDQFNPRP